MSSACPNGTTCVNGLCATNCTQTSQCPSGYTCDTVNQVCFIPCNNTTNPCTGANQVCFGGLCVQKCSGGNNTCPTGSNCVAGLCLPACGTSGSGNTGCLLNGVCWQGSCAAACDPNHPCPTGFTCVGTPPAAICVPSCTSNADCPAGQTCSGGACRVPVQVFYQQYQTKTPTGCVAARDGSGRATLNPAGQCQDPSSQWGFVGTSGSAGGCLYNAANNCYAALQSDNNPPNNGTWNWICEPSADPNTPFALAIGPGGSGTGQNSNQQTLVANSPGGYAGTFCIADAGNAGQNVNLNVCDITANGNSTIGFYAGYGCTT